MSVQVLRRAVDYDVGAVLERPLEIRRREGIVDDEGCVGRRRDVGDRRQVAQSQQRVRRGLHPDKGCLVSDCGGDGVHLRRVDVFDGDAEGIAQEVLEEEPCPAVNSLNATT